ncbi:spore germination protein [Thermolongibacillus altinsuensis]
MTATSTTFTVSESSLQDHFARCKDVVILPSTIQPADGSRPLSLLFVYCEELCDTKQLKQVIFPMFTEMGQQFPCRSVTDIEKYKLFPMTLIGKTIAPEQLDFLVFNGDLLVYFVEADVLYSITLANPPNRNPEEPNTEVSIRGPKDGFIEEVAKNVALIRKRLKTKSLRYEQVIVGKRSQTKVAILYMDDIINPTLIPELKRRISNLDIDALTGTNQLEELIGETRVSLFPRFSYTGRPDFVVNSLLNGRFALLVDGSPTALIGPANLTFLLNTSEDNSTSFLFVSFQRTIRLIGVSSSIFLPGLWVALTTFHPEQIPFTLLATIVLSRQGVPLPAALEMYIMLSLFEIFKEAGMRLPLAVGQTLSVVGGLIVGQAAINAGLSGPGSLVIAAISVISTFTLANQSLAGTVTLLRFIVLICSSLLGLFGFIVSIFFILVNAANMTSFNVPYLSPLSPLNRDVWKVIITSGWKLFKKRPKILETKDNKPKGGKA